MGGRKMEVLEYEALKAGMVFGSYKGVCEFLGARIQTGKGKIAQIERWRKQFNWVREGNGWRIVGVHVDVGAEEVGLKAVGLTAVLIVGHIINEIGTGNKIRIINENKNETYKGLKDKSEVATVSVKRDRLLFESGLVNKKFLQEQFRGEGGELIREFFREVRSSNNPFVMAALEELSEGKILNTNWSYEITLKGLTRVASLRESAEISEIYLSVLRELNCDNRREVFIKELTSRFFSRIRSELRTQMGISYCSETFLITAKLSTLDFYLRDTVKYLIDFENTKNLSNERSIIRLNKRFKAAYNRYLVNKSQDLGEFKLTKYKDLPMEYVEKNEEFIDRYVKLGAESERNSRRCWKNT